MNILRLIAGAIVGILGGLFLLRAACLTTLVVLALFLVGAILGVFAAPADVVPYIGLGVLLLVVVAALTHLLKAIFFID